MVDLLVLIVVVVLVGVGGVRLGMLLAPSIGRLASRLDDEPADETSAAEQPLPEEPRDDD